MNRSMLLGILALLTACAGAYMDLKTRKIPNRLVLPAMIAGLALNAVAGGVMGIWGSFAGIIVGFSMIVLWMLGAFKAGDVKLYMAIGAIGGWQFVLNAILASILVGGAAGLFLMAVRRNGRKSLKRFWNYGVNLLLSRKFHMYLSDDEGSYFCFGCCIAVGTAMSVICNMF